MQQPDYQAAGPTREPLPDDRRTFAQAFFTFTSFTRVRVLRISREQTFRKSRKRGCVEPAGRL